ncbi:MAG TPA: TetR family transcriptional regulator [Acidimicrobiales bacterium]|jgi:AcrR family transcriptional regulator
MSPGGRRPGTTDTRAQIVDAAKVVFAEHGYEKASLRAVARAAGVDAALVHHYFDGKPDLFMAAMAIPIDPRAVKLAAAPPDGPFSGAAVVEGFLFMWDMAQGTGSSFASCVGAMTASPAVADAVREFVAERVWSIITPLDGEDEGKAQLRVALVSSQLMGLAYNRYLLRVPPLSTATPGEIGQWVGPTLERYVLGELD